MIEHFLSTALHLAKHNLEKGPKNVQNIFQLETLKNAWVFENPGTPMIKISQHI